MTERLKVLDLFSGIGAYSLGLERTGGFQTVAFCEIEDCPRRILKQHWPDVPCYDDVTTLTGERLHADGIGVDWIVGGWPCQDISVAGSGSGLDGARSGLWSEIARLAGEIRPRGLLLENSSNLLAINEGGDFGRVLADLAALGYDAEWHCLPAAAFDAPHIRDRMWLIATRADTDMQGLEGWDGGSVQECAGQWTARPSSPSHVAHDSRHGEGIVQTQTGSEWKRVRPRRSGAGTVMADAPSNGRKPRRARDATQSEERRQSHRSGFDGPLPNADIFAPIGTAISRRERHIWESEPGLGRVASGVANRMDRLSAIGNCNPPQVVEALGRAILSKANP